MRALRALALEAAYAAAIRWLAPRRLGVSPRLTLFADVPGRPERVRIRIDRDYAAT